MLIDSYPVEDVFARVPAVAAQIDPILKTLDSLLRDDQLYQAIRTDLGKRYQRTLVHGRHSTPVEVILRLLLLKHLYSWSYEETVKRVADSLVLRWFCRVYFQSVSTKATLIRWAHILRPETLHALNDRVVQLPTSCATSYPQVKEHTEDRHWPASEQQSRSVPVIE
jgi:IS5 family transposase